MDYRIKLMISLCAVGVMVLAISILLVSVVLHDAFEDRVLVRINTIGRLASKEVTGKLERGDIEGIKRTISGLATEPRIRFVSILDHRDNVLLSSDSATEGAPTAYQDGSEVGIGKEDLYVRSYPLIRDMRVQGRLQIGHSLDRFRYDLRRIVALIAGGSSLMLILVIGMAYAASGYLLRPLVRMRTLAQRIAAGDFSGRMSMGSRDVIGQLSASFDDMSGRLLDLTRNLEEKVEARTEELSEANRRLRELDRQKSEFISFASHELRSPLSGIIGMVSLLRRQEADEERRSHLELIEGEARRMTRLVEDYLCISRIEAGIHAIDRRPVDLRALLEETCRTVAAGSGERILTRIGPLPHVSADPDRLRQVIRNLLDNALKYTPADATVAVSTSCHGGQVEVRVLDQGPGINEADLPWIFDKFYRGRDKATGQMAGSGIGLAIARLIVEAHGGTIRVESKPGGGACFTVSLPCAPANVLAPPSDAQAVPIDGPRLARGA
jgi:two-component system, OmpR family, sensor kinase